jgi:hypothetical protein
VQLLASSETATGGTDAPSNVIHGNVVAIAGGVGPGTQTDDPKVGFTGLTIVAENLTEQGTSVTNGISIGGNITAGKLDLEVHHGDLDLASTGVTRVNADTIRLAATDGHGGSKTGKVDLPSSLTFAGSDGTGPVNSVTLEQDSAFGSTAAGTAIPDIASFGDLATRKTALSLGLISQDGSIVLDGNDLINLNRLQPDLRPVADGGRPETGLLLTLAANGEEGAPAGQRAIRVSGGDLIVRQLTLGAAGVGGAVGGDTTITGNLTAGFKTVPPQDPNDPTSGFPGLAELGGNALSASGNLEVTGDAHLLGNVALNGGQDQTLDVNQLELTGQTTKTTTGLLTIDAANGVALNGSGSQSISNQQGALLITETTPGVVKTSAGNLLLSGVTAGTTTDAVTVPTDAVTVAGTGEFEGRQIALRTTDGDISVTATTRSNGVDGVGTYAIHGDVVGAGNVAMNGRGNLSGQASGYKFEARRSPSGAGGELTMGGIASTDGKVTLAAEGRDATSDDPHPAAIHLKGDFAVDALDVQDTVDVVGDTTITAQGDVVFGALDANGALDSGARIEGAKNFSVNSKGKVVLGDDVAMTAGTFAVGGNQGVQFVSDEDTQSIEAGSIVLGNGASSAPQGHGSLLRDGGLVLRASAGDVTVGVGQRLMVNGGLNIVTPGTATLSDTASLALAVTSSKLNVYGGSTVAANFIAVTANPKVTGGSSATFAVPTRDEISGNVPSDEILVRALTPTGQLLSFAPPPEGQPFDPLFPNITGLALFDYARLIPQPQPREPLTRPHADPVDLQLAVRERPLWAEELLGYLEMRSLESPNESGRPTEAEHLPPVGARPGDELEPSDSRVRTAPVENAVAAYRELFRADLRRDSESGVIEQPSQVAAIRAAFQAPVDALRREHGGKAVAGADVANLVESESRFDAAHRYREQIAALLDVAGRALIPDQRPRFRALVLAEVTPYGISSTEFESLF